MATKEEIQNAIDNIEDNTQKLNTPERVRNPMNLINDSIFGEFGLWTSDQGITASNYGVTIFDYGVNINARIFPSFGGNGVPINSRVGFIELPFSIDPTDRHYINGSMYGVRREFYATRQSANLDNIIGVYYSASGTWPANEVAIINLFLPYTRK